MGVACVNQARTGPREMVTEAKKAPARPPVPTKKLPVNMAYTVDPPRYGDSRGYFQELYNTQTYPKHRFNQVSLSRSQVDVLRGLHCSPYGKFVSCVEGAIFDVFVDLREDSPTFLKWTGRVLSEENKAQMYIPPRCGHGFYSMRDNSKILYMQEGCYTPGADVEVHPFDKKIGIEWPKPKKEYILSGKDTKAKTLDELLPRIRGLADFEKWGNTVDYVVIGASGFFGGKVCQILTEQKKNFARMPSWVRLSDRENLARFLDRWKPKYVINCAGTAGKPNIGWCEDHKEETIDINLTGQLNVAEVCRQRGIHCTLFGTGCLYSYDKEHKMVSGKGYTEEDPPNFTGNFYGKMRIALENLVKSYKNVLSLRIAFPIDGYMHPRSLVAKLLKYPRITSTPTSYTVMDSLYPLISQMAERNLTGIYNFTNPGVTTNGSLLRIYKRVVDPTHTWEDVEAPQTSVPRAYSELDVTKLRKAFPNILPVEEAVTQAFEALAKRRQVEQKEEKGTK
ncbi:hypothetical protein AAMO2058_000472200 [Amorphochlora amoebiformis]